MGKEYQFFLVPLLRRGNEHGSNGTDKLNSQSKACPPSHMASAFSKVLLAQNCIHNKGAMNGTPRTPFLIITEVGFFCFLAMYVFSPFL